MDLPVMPPVRPMLARLVRSLPEGALWYEPKWDGFRCVVFRDGPEVELASRHERSLTRYFPEVVDAVRSGFPARAVVDGELVVAGASGLDFDALSQRIHPAASRVRQLAGSTPASFVAFDLLALGGRDLRAEAFRQRRALLEESLGAAGPPLHVTPATQDPAVARDWFSRFEGAGLDGVVAKAADLAYREDERVMAKVKHERSAEFVVAGLRWYRADPRRVGSLLLGLYDGDTLVHVGVIGAFPAAQRAELAEQLSPYHCGGERHPWSWGAAAPGGTRRGGGSRWSAGKDLSFQALRPELVVEAAYEHLQGHRLRHTARFRRWRPDRDPASCTYDQLEVAPPAILADVFDAGAD